MNTSDTSKPHEKPRYSHKATAKIRYRDGGHLIDSKLRAWNLPMHQINHYKWLIYISPNLDEREVIRQVGTDCDVDIERISDDHRDLGDDGRGPLHVVGPLPIEGPQEGEGET